MRRFFRLISCGLGGIISGCLLAGCQFDEKNSLRGGQAYGTAYLDAYDGGVIFQLDNLSDRLKGSMPSGIKVYAGDRAFLVFNVNFSESIQTSRGTAYETEFLYVEKFPTGQIRPAGADAPAFNDQIPLLYDPWITYLDDGNNVITIRAKIPKTDDYSFVLQYQQDYKGEKEVPLMLYYNAGSVKSNTEEGMALQSFIIPSTIKPNPESSVTLPLQLKIAYNAKNTGSGMGGTSEVVKEYYPEGEEEL